MSPHRAIDGSRAKPESARRPAATPFEIAGSIYVPPPPRDFRKPRPLGLRLFLAAPVFFFLALAAAGAGDAYGQATPVCSNTPAEGQRVECKEGTDSTADIEIDLSDVTIATTERDEAGVLAQNDGTGDIVIRADKVTIRTGGEDGDGVSGLVRVLDGLANPETVRNDIAIEVTDADIEVSGRVAAGVSAWHARRQHQNGSIQNRFIHSRGDIAIRARGGRIVARGSGGDGIRAQHQFDGDIDIDARDLFIRIEGKGSGSGITGRIVGRTGGSEAERAMGQVRIYAENVEIVNAGYDGASGIFARRNNASQGGIRIDVRSSTITTGEGSEDLDYAAFAVRAISENSDGDIVIDVRDSKIETRGTGIDPNYEDNFSLGVSARFTGGTGDIVIDLRGGSVTTAGFLSYGVYASQTEEARGDIWIATHPGNSIVTTGEGGHGILAHHAGGPGKGVWIAVGGSVKVSGAGAQGVRVGHLDGDGNPAQYAPLDADGYRRQTVTVDGSIESAAEGVFLANGGRVVIGPQGTIRSDSGIAVLATGTAPADSTATPPVQAIAPKLWVDLNLDGRRVETVRHTIGGDWIVNDGGRTTIAVNGHVLHDADGGATDTVVRNGAWDVRWEALSGVRVTDRSDPDPANWTVESRDSVDDRDFNADYLIGALVEEYAPRAAVYEALPGFLLGLGAPGLGGSPGCREERMASPGTSVWARVSGGRRSFEPGAASVGAAYEANRFAVEFGVDFPLGEPDSDALTGCASVHRIQGWADVTSAAGGGKLSARGFGASFGLSMERDGFHAKTRASLTHYSVDASSSGIGLLRKNASALVGSIAVEAGRRFAAGAGTSLTPRVWMTGAAVVADGFTDTVASRVRISRARRAAGGLGLDAETRRIFRGGELTLRGSLGLERTLTGRETETEVSGTRLASETPAMRFLAGLGAAYRKGAYSVSAHARMAGAGSRDADYSGSLTLGVRF